MEVRLVKSGQTGKNKGFAFVRFASAAAAKMALESYSQVEVILLFIKIKNCLTCVKLYLPHWFMIFDNDLVVTFYLLCMTII